MAIWRAILEILGHMVVIPGIIGLVRCEEMKGRREGRANKITLEMYAA